MLGGKDLPVLCALDLHRPESDRYEGLAFAFAVDDEGKGGTLHPAHREELLAQTGGGQGDVAGQAGAPNQVDVLPRLSRLRQVVIDVLEVVESMLYLRGRESGETGPLDGDIGADFPDLAHHIRPDQLALAVEVGGDDQFVRILGILLDVLEQGLVVRGLDDFGPYQCPGIYALPLLIFLGEVDFEDVALQADAAVFFLAPLESISRAPRLLQGLDLVPGKDLGDAASGSVLLGYDQFHLVSPLFRPNIRGLC